MNKTQLSRLFWAIKISLVVAIVYVAAGTVVAPLRVGETFKPREASGREPVKTPDDAVPAPQPAPDYSAIASSRLFGGSDERPERPDLNPQSAASRDPGEELDLRLVGTLASGPDVSRALIENGRARTTELYRIGETVASATIESIERDRVVLRYRGHARTLMLNTEIGGLKTEDGGQAPAVSASSKPAPSSDIRLPASEPSRLGQVETLLRKATIEPYVQKGQPEGLKLTGLENVPAAIAFGLRNGDVIQSVNGQVLTSKQKAFQVLQKARTQPKFNMQLLRDGKVMHLSFNAH
jgi:general secretion pathway protein C